MFTKDLSANVPLYGQEQCCWCGPASAQMTRNGYPNAVDRHLYTQQFLWNSIQTNNSTDPADAGWCTDPHGMTGCLQSLANPSGVHWVERADTNRDQCLFFTIYWMNQRGFPAPTLVNRGGHWVVIVGYQTDVEPTAGSTPVLQRIIIHDPEPHNVGTDTTITGAQWYAGYWNGSVVYSGTWQNQYVSVVEPPIGKGTAKVKPVKRTGDRLLSPAKAVEFARRWIKQLNLGRDPRYSLFEHKELENLEPLVVREEPSLGNRTKAVPYYYIVPFSLRGESELGRRLVRLCVLINAFTGEFEEVTSFGKPVSYLSPEAARDIVAAAMRIGQDEIARVETTLLFIPSEITHIRSFPFWQVKVGRKTVYVDQMGQLYGRIPPSRPGD